MSADDLVLKYGFRSMTSAIKVMEEKDSFIENLKKRLEEMDYNLAMTEAELRVAKDTIAELEDELLIRRVFRDH